MLKGQSRAVPQTFRFRTHHLKPRLKPILTLRKCSRERTEVHSPEMSSKDQMVPTLSLCGVALLWATFGPCLRFIYAGEGGPQPAVLAAVTAVITSIALLTYAKAVQFKDGMKTGGSRLPLDEVPLDPEPDLPSLEISTPAAQMSATQGKGLTLRGLLTRKTDSLRAASMELGVLGAAGSLVHTVGLTQVPATTAGFLVQSTTVITPLLAFIAGDRISNRTWTACAVAACGTVLVTFDGLSEASSSLAGALAGGTVTGKLTVLSAALFYSLSTFRLSQLSPAFGTADLAAGKNLVRCSALIAAAVPAVLQALQSSPGNVDLGLVSLWPSMSAVGVIAMTYSALGPGALSAVLQTYGQRSVSAPVAQVIYTSIPLWSGGLAYVYLGEQPFGMMGWGGAACIICAGLITASDGASSNS